ncbi:MAG: hypothetical protein JWO36_7125 [Myxococcales bacterium]|nr:hypothetical protein [Myxococcales bacterium]
MRIVALLAAASMFGCGGQPALANAPHPDTGAVAGVAAAAAAAAVLADPDAANRKPEKKEVENKREIEVKENVPASVFDHLEQPAAAGSGSGSAEPVKATPAVKRKGPPPKIPLPKDVADPANRDDANR